MIGLVRVVWTELGSGEVVKDEVTPLNHELTALSDHCKVSGVLLRGVDMECRFEFDPPLVPRLPPDA